MWKDSSPSIDNLYCNKHDGMFKHECGCYSRKNIKTKDKKEFDKWLNPETKMTNKRAYYEEAWMAACEYKQKEIDDLRQKLEASDAVIDCFYEATRKVGW
jgi:hypothetical protein